MVASSIARCRSLAAAILAVLLAFNATRADEPDAPLDPAEIRQFRGHTFDTTSVAIAPDGRMAASGDNDTTVRLWNVDTGEELRVLKDHKDYVLCVAFTPDGSRVLSGGGGQWDAGLTFFGPGTDHTLRMWDVKTGEVVRRFEGHTAPIWCVAVSPDGRHVLSGAGGRRVGEAGRESFGHELILWSASGMLIRQLEGNANWVRGVAFSPDSKQGASACRDGTVRLWELETGREVMSMQAERGLNSVAYSPDGKTLLTGGSALQLWDVATGKQLKNIAGHDGTIWSAAFSPDGRRAVTASDADRSIRLWDIDSGEQLHHYVGHTDAVRRAVFTPDGRNILSASHDDTLRLWRVVE